MKRVAIVTGASRGIGRGIALYLARQDWAVVINYSSNAQAAQEVLEEAQKSRPDCMMMQADISDPLARKALIEKTFATYGEVNLLVNNAGIAPWERKDLLDMSEESYDRIMDVNLKGPFFLTQLFAKTCLEKRRGSSGPPSQAHIVNINSISAYTSSINRGEYCISKAGMSMMTSLFADRLASEGIHVFEIRPGIIETDMTGKVKEKYDTLIEDGLTPIRRWGTPDDIAKAVWAIAENFFPFSTGEVLNVDGGFQLRRL